MQGLIPCVSPLATCPPLCLIVWKIDMWLCIVLDWVRGWVARMGFLLPALSPDPPDLLDARHVKFNGRIDGVPMGVPNAPSHGHGVIVIGTFFC
jgi:hypothetical protein